MIIYLLQYNRNHYKVHEYLYMKQVQVILIILLKHFKINQLMIQVNK